jgi:hypothetical protein
LLFGHTKSQSQEKAIVKLFQNKNSITAVIAQRTILLSASIDQFFFTPSDLGCYFYFSA